jgi:hypothetical protein
LSGSADPVFEDVETWCSLKRSRPVVLSLSVESAPKGSVITGFAVSCDCEFGCLKGVHCLLGKRITTGRKRK